MSMRSVSEAAVVVRDQALSILDGVGNAVARGGTAAAGALGAAGKNLGAAARSSHSDVVRRSGAIAEQALTSASIQLRTTFAIPERSPVTTINFQAGTASAFDAAFLMAGAVSSAVPGVQWIGSGATAVYGAMRYAPGALAQWSGQDDAQSQQAREAGKMIVCTAIAAALTPPIVASAVFASAASLSARNARVMIAR